MNVLLAARMLGRLLMVIGMAQFLPLLTALWFGESPVPFLASGLACGVVGFAIQSLIKPESLRVRPRDGFLIVSAAWIVASLAGAIPYLATGSMGPWDALFESVAGFTTTGASVMHDIEAQPRSLLLWRSLSQWLGGMGIVVIAVALMPLLGIGGMQLFKAEVPGPVKEKITPRVAKTAQQLWIIYIGFTVLQAGALMLAGMPGFDAICHSLTTLSTGGFSTRNASLGAYDSAAIEWIVIVFMILAGVNFVLHFRFLQGRYRAVFKDAELRYYLGLLAIATVVVVLGLVGTGWGAGQGVHATVRSAAFAVVSILTTTGYATADFETWPGIAQLVLLVLMILGAMAGSTSGGAKSLRTILAFRAVRATFAVSGHRNAVRPAVRYAGRPVPSEVLTGVWTFFAAYFALIAVAAFGVAAAGYDLVTALTAGFTIVGNVGPGLGEIGPFDNYAHFPAFVKLLLSGCMIAGRLELFTLLVLLNPGFWRN
jgi:trk system potassium uptake protein TrkH